MRYVRVPNLSKYQHYSNRVPPWIKLHRSVLDSYSISKLSDIEQGQLFKIWVLASQMDNKIPFDTEWIKKKIGSNSKVDLQAFVDAGHLEFTELASMTIDTTIAPCKHDPHSHGGTEERRGETEKRREEEIVARARPPTKKKNYDFTLEQWMTQQGITDIPKEWGDYAFEKLGLTVAEINLEWDKFSDFWKGKGERGKKADWAATWRNWCRQAIEFKNQRKGTMK